MGTTKARFIELHGEEAWEIEKEKRRTRGKKWEDNNRDKKNAKAAIYRENNKEAIKERQKTFYENHPDKKSQYGKKYSDTHQEQIKEYHKKHKETKEKRASSLRYQYKRRDKVNNREGFNLTQKWILDNIFAAKCIYCGDSDWHHLGCDRINDEKPHTPDNCVCACALCNVERFYKGMSVDEFVEYRKIVPIDGKLPKLEKVVEINGKRVIKKVG